MSLRQSTVRLSPDQIVGVETLAREANCTPAELIRRAINHYIGTQKQLSQGELRHHRISEYSQVALDAIINQQYPDLRPRILAETDRRMEKYHAR